MLKTGTICATALLAMLARPALADVRADVRAFLGAGNGVGADVWSGTRIRADVELDVLFVPFYWASAGIVGRVLGDQRRFLGVRGGYQIEYDAEDGHGTWRGSRTAQAIDASLVARVESARGSAVEAQAGPEAVFRASSAVCCDNAALATRSLGVRATLLGELALSDAVALFARAGVRTADHLQEIKWMPTASVGVRYRF